ncbi:MAG: MFS transporter, partial [Burkholderiales bacterium]
YSAVGLINVFGDMGAAFAVGVAALATAYRFNWRIAFMLGACIALIGSMARTALRETPEFADAKKRLNKLWREAGTQDDFWKGHPLYQEAANKKTAWAYFSIMCTGPTFLYFVYFYSHNILKINFHYSAHRILIHSLLVSIFQLVSWAILRAYLSSKIYPLKILQAAWGGLLISVPFLPWLLEHITAPWHLFLIQSMIVLLRVTDLPAAPIFLKNFPVFKRFSYASVLYAVAYALMFSISSFGLPYLVDHLGYWGLLVIMLPVLIGYGFGLRYFKQLEIAAGRYPK